MAFGVFRARNAIATARSHILHTVGGRGILPPRIGELGLVTQPSDFEQDLPAAAPMPDLPADVPAEFAPGAILARRFRVTQAKRGRGGVELLATDQQMGREVLLLPVAEADTGAFAGHGELLAWELQHHQGSALVVTDKPRGSRWREAPGQTLGQAAALRQWLLRTIECLRASPPPRATTWTPDDLWYHDAGFAWVASGAPLRPDTPYAAPELAEDPNADRERATQFNLAAIAYEVLTQRAPRGRLAPVREVRRDVDAALANTIDRAMATAADHRFPDLAAFAAALTAPARAGGPRQLALAAGAAAALLATGGWAWVTFSAASATTTTGTVGATPPTTKPADSGSAGNPPAAPPPTPEEEAARRAREAELTRLEQQLDELQNVAQAAPPPSRPTLPAKVTPAEEPRFRAESAAVQAADARRANALSALSQDTNRRVDDLRGRLRSAWLPSATAEELAKLAQDVRAARDELKAKVAQNMAELDAELQQQLQQIASQFPSPPLDQVFADGDFLYVLTPGLASADKATLKNRAFDALKAHVSDRELDYSDLTAIPQPPTGQRAHTGCQWWRIHVR
jgi:hypothetical protein